MNAKRLVIFDWDGTMLDSISHIAYCLADTVKAYQGVVPEESAIRELVGLGAMQVTSILCPDLPLEKKEQLIADYRKLFTQTANQSCQLFPGAQQLLLDLKNQGYKLAIATGKGRTALENNLRGLGLQYYFDATRTAGETEDKPSPSMVFEILQELGCSAAESILLGDTCYDIDMANNAKIDAVAVTYGAHPVCRLKKSKPFALIDNLSQFYPIIGLTS